MRCTLPALLILVLASLGLFSCDRKLEDFKVEQVSTEYLPLQPGKYITYRLDSLVFTNFGRTEETHYYEEKHVIDQQFNDNEGRPSFRVYRFLRDTTGTQPWSSAGTYYITIDSNRVEQVENNLRFFKLYLPLKEGVTWRGNAFLPDYPYQSYGLTANMDLWDYYYESLDESLTLNNHTFENVVVVKGIDESANYPVTNAEEFGYRNLYIDKYAKGIGLIYQEVILREYQPNLTGTGGPFTVGFGVKRSIIDHN